jgi:hypothetical protein
MFTIMVVLVLLACASLVAAAVWPPKIPWWVSVGFLCLIELIRILPLR